MTLSSACWAIDGKRGPLRDQEARRRRGHRASSPTTCAKSCWPRRWGRRTCSRSTPASAPAASWSCLDRQGKLLHNDVIYPAPAATADRRSRGQTVKSLVEQYQIEAIAIGNGTAGRETEKFVRGLKLPAAIAVVMVNESRRLGLLRLRSGPRGIPRQGRDRARRRLHRPPPDGPAGRAGEDRPQVHRRGPVPARRGPGRAEEEPGRRGDDLRQQRGRRGQHRHRKQLLAYVSGLGATLAKNIVRLPQRQRRLHTRAAICKRCRAWATKAFEQAAGFLRIRDGEHPLDASAVHPESYEHRRTMAARPGLHASRDLMRDEALRAKIDKHEVRHRQPSACPR